MDTPYPNALSIQKSGCVLGHSFAQLHPESEIRGKALSECLVTSPLLTLFLFLLYFQGVIWRPALRGVKLR